MGGGRSEGTPHNTRATDFDPGLPNAVFLQNTLILWDAVPRAMPWAGMRCPVGAYWTITVSVTRAHRVSVTGLLTAFPLLWAVHRVSVTGPSTAFPLLWAVHRGSDAMP